MRKGGRRKEEHEEHMNHEGWLLPYADMITLLFILFTVLYVMSTVDADKYNSLANSLKVGFNSPSSQEMAVMPPKEADAKIRNEAKERDKKNEAKAKAAQQEQMEMDKLEQKLREFIAIHKLESQVFVNADDRGVQVTFQDVSLFSPGSATLSVEAKNTLKGIVPFFKDTDRHILIEGHTDNVPIGRGPYRDNFQLSSERALSVLRFLQDNEIRPSRLSAQGFGEFSPVADNSTKEGKSKNRRVNVTILRNQLK